MKGKHVSKKSQSKLLQSRKISEMTISELSGLAKMGKRDALKELRRRCGWLTPDAR